MFNTVLSGLCLGGGVVHVHTICYNVWTVWGKKVENNWINEQVGGYRVAFMAVWLGRNCLPSLRDG